ncbi:excalibur calcium-binding domain-containing protein [Streptomyces sp. NPDC051217]|uniref:excalibur calcium-binding domain-containing protein n=1 Tax=Streptomyces sp. NPDC051217 TaxID=3365644 RepID=UPI003799F5F5
MSFSPPAAPGPSPYTGPPAPPPGRPKWTRKRVLLPLVALLFFLGIAIGGAGGTTEAQDKADAKPGPAATVTATATATPEPAATETVTATPKPAPTVTETKSVRVTVAPAADDNGDSGGSTGSDTGGSGGGSTYYANCTAVRAAGADPIRTGDPGYGSHLDRDGDGVACE